MKTKVKKQTSRGWRKHFKNVGIGHIRGYAGLVNTAVKISEYIPKCKEFVEPFAGLGRITKKVNAELKIINDKSDYAYNYLKKHFPDAVVCNMDWYEFVHRYIDGDVFFFDPPWSEAEYKEGCLDRSFCDRSVSEYYEQRRKFRRRTLIVSSDELPKHAWQDKLGKICFIAGNKKNSYLKECGFHSILIQSNKKIMGGRISTLLVSNKPLKQNFQTKLN